MTVLERMAMAMEQYECSGVRRAVVYPVAEPWRAYMPLAFAAIEALLEPTAPVLEKVTEAVRVALCKDANGEIWDAANCSIDCVCIREASIAARAAIEALGGVP